MKEKEIQITLYATLSKYHPHEGGSKPFVFTIKDSLDLEELLDKLSIPKDESKQIFVNNRRQELEYQLQQGDRVAIFPPIAGG